jgi:hypothetical protein
MPVHTCTVGAWSWNASVLEAIVPWRAGMIALLVAVGIAAGCKRSPTPAAVSSTPATRPAGYVSLYYVPAASTDAPTLLCVLIQEAENHAWDALAAHWPEVAARVAGFLKAHPEVQPRKLFIIPAVGPIGTFPGNREERLVSGCGSVSWVELEPLAGWPHEAISQFFQRYSWTWVPFPSDARPLQLPRPGRVTLTWYLDQLPDAPGSDIPHLYALLEISDDDQVFREDLAGRCLPVILEGLRLFQTTHGRKALVTIGSGGTVDLGRGSSLIGVALGTFAEHDLEGLCAAPQTAHALWERNLRELKAFDLPTARRIDMP